MAIVHATATIKPTKPELLGAELGGPVEIIGSYRFDDPEGEVGVEGFVVRSGDDLAHVVLTYRGEPLDTADARLVSTMEHTVLGPRWIYDGTTDPVAIACFRRAILGAQEQAVLEVFKDGQPAGTREQSVRLRASEAQAEGRMDGTVRILRNLGEPAAAPALVASWDGGEAVVATLVD